MERKFENEMNIEPGTSKGIMKNKFQTQRRVWTLWKSLKNGATGLGWDAAAGTVAATEEWWNARIQENFEFTKFKTNGIPPDAEEMMDFLYGGTYATGIHCKVPSTQHKTQEESITDMTLDEQFDFVRDQSDADGAEMDRTETQMEDGDMGNIGSAGGYVNSMLRSLDDVQLKGDVPVTNLKSVNKKRLGACNSTGKIVKKKNARQSFGSVLFQEHMSLSVEASKAKQ